MSTKTVQEVAEIAIGLTNNTYLDFLTQDERSLLIARPKKGVPAHIWSVLGYEPNPWSLYHLHTSAARFNAFATSRQVGKTTSLVYELLDALFAAPRDDDQTHARDVNNKILVRRPNLVGVISDTLEHALLVVEPFISVLEKLLGDNAFSLNKNMKHLVLNPEFGSHELRWLSAENPRSGQGFTFSSVFVDEAQNVSDEFFVNLRPALGARMARVYACGTPDPVADSTWFEGMFINGLDEDNLDYYAYSIPCTLNKWLPEQDVRDALYSLTETEFKMKYLGQWTKSESAVFKNPETCFLGKYEEPTESAGPYSIGLDLAKHVDFTVAYVIDTRRKAIVARERFNHLDYVAVSNRVTDLYKKYRARRVRMDSTGPGAPIADMLRHNGVRVYEFVFTNKSKGELVSTLAREIEHKRVIFPKEDAQLLRELRAFTRSVTKQGNIQYSAPVNANDDCVMAAGLALLEARNTGQTRTMSYIDG